MDAAENQNGAPPEDAQAQPQLHQFAVIDGDDGAQMLPPAAKGQRFIASILDAIFSGILSALGTTVLVKGLAGGSIGAGALWGIFFPLMYFVFPLYATGQTLGKKLMKIKVVHVDPTQELGMGRLFFREFVGKTICVVCLLLGYVRILTHPDRRGWHDSMAKTRVVSIVEE